MPENPRSRALRAGAVAALLTATGVIGGCAAGAGGGPESITFHLSKPEAIPYFRDLID